MLGMWMMRDCLRGVRLWQFVSRKFLRWLTLLPMMMVFIGSVLLAREPLFAVAFGAQLLFYIAALGAVVRNHLQMPSIRFLSIPLYVVVGAAAALTGVVDMLSGKRFATWNIPTLSRGAGDRAA
jgi:hypothetical protein